jgi:hypothetical protein
MAGPGLNGFGDPVLSRNDTALPTGARLEVRCQPCFDGVRREVVTDARPTLSVIESFPRLVPPDATVNVRAVVPRAGSKTWRIVERGNRTATAEIACLTMGDPVAYAC